MVTGGQRRRVDEGNPHTAAFARMERTTEEDECAGQQCDKAYGATEARERRAQMRHDILDVVMLKRAVVTPMKIDQDNQNLAERQRRGTGPLALPGLP
jgi:hypothetical protein